MPKTKISEFDSVAANNTDIDGINLGEGMLPSDVNNAIRELMAQIKDLQAGTSGDSIPASAGGTGRTTLTANNVLLGNGTSTVNFVAPGTSGNVLTSNGTTWTSAAAGASLSGQTDSATPFETSLGYQAGNVTTGTNNTFIGYQAGLLNDSGYNNTAVGFKSLDANTNGEGNTAVGESALTSNTSGYSNTAVGKSSMSSATTAINNTALGINSAFSMTTGGQNVAIGHSALRDATTPDSNVAVGYEAIRYVTTGYENTAIGTLVGNGLTTGFKNTLVGYAVDVGSNAQNQIVIGNSVTGNANNRITIGSAGGSIYNDFTADASWFFNSDISLKNIVGDDTLGLSFIKRLNPIKFTWKPQNELPKDHPNYAETNEKDTTTIIHGFIAQEIKSALDAEGCSTFNGWAKDKNGIQSISREMLVSPLVKAIQELSSQIEVLKQEINELKGV
jgi:hypothetical protein